MMRRKIWIVTTRGSALGHRASETSNSGYSAAHPKKDICFCHVNWSGIAASFVLLYFGTRRIHRHCHFAAGPALRIQGPRRALRIFIISPHTGKYQKPMMKQVYFPPYERSVPNRPTSNCPHAHTRVCKERNRLIESHSRSNLRKRGKPSGAFNHSYRAPNQASRSCRGELTDITRGGLV